MDLSRIATNLRLTEAGVWTSGSSGGLSFPAGGHDECFRVEEGSFWFRHRNACLLEVLRLFPPGGALFELGGGNGFVAQALARAGYETVLLEPAHEGARNALARGLSLVICSTFEAAAFRDGSIPAAAMFDVLEHTEDDAAFLSHVHRALAPGGRFYLTVPAYRALWSAEDEHAGHFRRYSARGLRERLAGAGFLVERTTYFFAPLVLPIVLFRVVPHRLGLASGGSAAIDEKVRRQHAPGSGTAARSLVALLALELLLLRRGLRIPFGSSCLAVARKA